MCTKPLLILQWWVFPIILKTIAAADLIENELYYDSSYIDTEQEREEQIHLKDLGKSRVAVFSGSYKYETPNGAQVYVTYVADENGYVPTFKILGPSVFSDIGYAEPIASEHLIESLIHNG